MNLRSPSTPRTLLAGFCALLFALSPQRSLCAATEVKVPVITGAQAATLQRVGLVVRAPGGTTSESSKGTPVVVALPGAGVGPAAAVGVSLVAMAMVGGVTLLVDHLNQGYLAEIFNATQGLDYEATLARTLAGRATPADMAVPVLLSRPWPENEAAMNALPAKVDLDAVLFVDVQWGFQQGVPFPQVVAAARLIDRQGRPLWSDLFVFQGPEPVGFGVKERHEWWLAEQHVQTILLHAANAMSSWLDEDLWKRRVAPATEGVEAEMFRVWRQFGGIRWPLYSDNCVADSRTPALSYVFVRYPDRLVASAKCAPKWVEEFKTEDWQFLARLVPAKLPLPAGVPRAQAEPAQ